MPYCVPCDREFRHWDAHIQHMLHSSYHNYCEDCDKDFDTWQGLRQHFLQSPHHAFCRQCDTHFDDDEELLGHCLDVHYYCERCDRFLRNEQGLHEHRRQCHDYCADCRRVFDSPNSLKNHMNSRVHRPRDVPCVFQHLGCNKYFVSKSAMILHLENGACTSGADRAMVDSYVRQRDRHHFITVPQRRITGGVVIRQYIATERSWNGEAYECVLCHRMSQTLDDLNRHLASPAHQEKIYRCPHKDCPTTFPTLSALCQHIESEKCGVMKFIVREGLDRLVGNMKRLCIQGTP